MGAEKTAYLCVYDYGQGGAWYLVEASSPEEIMKSLPFLKAYRTRPEWMSEEEELRYRRDCEEQGLRWDIANPPEYLLEKVEEARRIRRYGLLAILPEGALELLPWLIIFLISPAGLALGSRHAAFLALPLILGPLAIKVALSLPGFRLITIPLVFASGVEIVYALGKLLLRLFF